MVQELLFDHLEDELELSLGVLLRLDPTLHILSRLLQFLQARLHRIETVMLCDEFTSHHSFAIGAFDADHLACLLVLHDVAARTLDLAVGCRIASHSLNFTAVTSVVLEHLLLEEFFVAELALEK